MLWDRQSAQRTSSAHPASHKFSPSSVPHMLHLIHFPHFGGDESLQNRSFLNGYNWKVMRLWCQSAEWDTGKQTTGWKIGPRTAAPSVPFAIKFGPESEVVSLPLVYFTSFLFSFKWGHNKTRVASYPSELFISGIISKSLEVRWKNKAPHKTLQKASCFNILRGLRIWVLVKREIVSEWKTMKWNGKVQLLFIVLLYLVSVDTDCFDWEDRYKLCPCSRQRQNTTKTHLPIIWEHDTIYSVALDTVLKLSLVGHGNTAVRGKWCLEIV